MKNSKVISLMIGGFLALTLPVFINPHKADADNYSENLCRRAVVGTYLATLDQTNSTPGQPSSFREITTFTEDGNIIANDSFAGGVPGSSKLEEQPFGPLQGSWKCTGKNKIVGKALNFTYPSGSLPGGIVVNEYDLTFNPRTRSVSGTFKYSFYDLNSNPMDQNTQPLPLGIFELSYEGVKVEAE